MKPLNPRVVASALSLFGGITFSLCILWDALFPPLSMVAIWRVLLPGFQGIGLGSYFLGLAEMVLYGVYAGLVFVPLYNWLARHLAGPAITEGGLRHV